MGLAFGIAVRYLRAQKGDGFVSALVWFALIGIALGVATLIIVMSVMNGFRHDLQARILGINGHLKIESPSLITDYPYYIAELEKLPNITRISAQIDQQVLFIGGGRVLGGLVRGITWQGLQENPIVQNAITQGHVQDRAALAEGFDSGNGVLIGERMAWSLGITIGDRLTILSPQTNATAFGSTPRRKGYVVRGIFRVGMSEYDQSLVFMPLLQAQKLFRMPNAVSTIEMLIDNPDQAIDMSQDIAPIVREVPSVRITPWQYAHASFFQALQVERNVMFIILSLVVMIAAFNIIISQVMLVREKSGSIAILRAIGTPRRTLMQVFFFTGALIGGVGTLLGVLIGVSFALNIEHIRVALETLLDTQVFSPEVYFLSTLPSRLESQDMINIVTLALGLSFLASLYAARGAIKIDPIKVLRHAR